MESGWLTYQEAAERLGSTAEAVRYRALRGKWARIRGNDGRARVQLPDEPNPVRTPSAQPVRTPSEPRADLALLHALEAHNATLKADVERLETQLRIEADRLAAAEARIERQAADFAAREVERTAELAVERENTMKAIEVFSALADRLDALATERARRSWWRRLLA
jgi:DNA primase